MDGQLPAEQPTEQGSTIRQSDHSKAVVIGIALVLASVILSSAGYGVFYFVYGGKIENITFLRKEAFACPEGGWPYPYDPENKVTSYELKEALRNPEGVCRLDLSGKGLTEFPKEILKFPNLKRLILNNNQLSSIPDEIENMKTVLVIDISDNKFEKVPRGITRMVWLDQLALSNNPIQSLPSGLFGLTELTQLHLNGTKISDLSASIKYLSKLELLYLNKTKLTSVPSEIGDLTQLKILSLKGVNISASEKARVRGLLPNTQVIFD